MSDQVRELSRVYIVPLLLLAVLLQPSSAAIVPPVTYQCTAVRISQEKNGRVYSKGYQTPSLYLTITNTRLSAIGTHSEISICQEIDIRRIYRDTLFLFYADAPVLHSDLKLYLVNDTLKGNVNIFERDTSKVSITALVKKVPPGEAAKIRKTCR